MIKQHKPTNIYCLVAHFDKDGNLLPACNQCSCGEFVAYGQPHPKDERK